MQNHRLLPCLTSLTLIILVSTLTGSVYSSEVRNLELFPVGDSFIYKDNPTSNYGKELYLYTEYENQKTIVYGSSFSVGPFNSHSISVSLPHNGKISGSFSVTGGSGNDIDFRIEGLTTYYSESRVTSLTFSFEAPYSGSFDLVFDNSFSWVSSKTVSLSDVTLSMNPFGVISSPIFLLFDLSSIPPQATIDTAKLTLSLWSQWESSYCIVAAFQCSQNSWGEQTINYENAPMSQIYPSSSSSLNTSGLTYGSICEWNIKSDVVRSLLSGKLTEVLAILASDQTRKIEFFSRESDKKPKLEISYTYASVEASVWPSVIGQGQNVAVDITTNPLQTQGTLTFQYSQDQIVWQNITSFSGGSKEYAWSPTMSGLIYLRVLWSISWASGSYSTSKTTTLNIDVVSPDLSIMAPGVNTTLKSSDVKVTWEGSDADSGIDHYELKADFSFRNDELVVEPYEWNAVATNANFTFRGVPDGDHIVYVKAVDKVGLSSERSVTFTVNTSILGGPGWTDDIIVFGSTATAIVVVGLGIFFLRRKRLGLPPPP